MGFRARIEDLSASEIASLTRRVHTDLTVRFSDLFCRFSGFEAFALDSRHFKGRTYFGKGAGG